MPWLYASAYFAATVILHAFLCRSRLGANIVMKFLMVGAPMGALLVLHQSLVNGLSLALFAAALFYAFLCEFYIFVFASIPASISISLLVTLSGKGMTQQAIDDSYASTAMVRWRLEGLEREGFLTQDASGYAVTEKGRKLARVFRTLQDIFGHSKGELLAPRASKG